MNEQWTPTLAPDPIEYLIGSPVMVRLHRVAHGWPMKQLAQEAKVSAAHVSRVEPSAALGVHRFRSIAAAQWKRDRVWAQANLAAMRLGRMTACANITPVLALPELDPADFGPEFGEIGVARALRNMWRVSGPIGSMVELLEAAGIFVVLEDFGDCDLDAVTLRATSHHPHLIYLNAALVADRLRETLAHELGHLVMDNTSASVSRGEIERRATEFAREFLAPIGDVGADLDRIGIRTIHELDELQIAWGVSVTWLVTRARDRGCLSDYQYRSLFRFLNETGRIDKPSPRIACESPRLVAAVLEEFKAAGYRGPELDEITLLTATQRGALFPGVPEPTDAPRHLVVVSGPAQGCPDLRNEPI